MSDDLEDAVAELLRESDAVRVEYEKGYIDADAALSRIETRLDDLEAVYEGE